MASTRAGKTKAARSKRASRTGKPASSAKRTPAATDDVQGHSYRIVRGHDPLTKLPPYPPDRLR
jgi:hypothetical protein